jgi:hypothetical protein
MGRPGASTPPSTQIVKLRAIQQPNDIIQTLRFNISSPFLTRASPAQLTAAGKAYLPSQESPAPGKTVLGTGLHEQGIHGPQDRIVAAVSLMRVHHY